jgi:hypothetical protein
MFEFLKGWGSLIIAAVALAQPWVIGLFKKCFKRKRVEIYETGAIEIGLSTFGPTVGLFGTLNAMHGDGVVRNMTLKVVRLKDKAEHDFSWRFFRSPKFFATGPDPQFNCVRHLLFLPLPLIISAFFFGIPALWMRPYL